MPPKVWKANAPVATPALGAKPVPASSPASQQKVAAFVGRQISDNNLLGLSEGEIQGAASNIASCKTKKEVFDWCGTFMLEESIAAEIVKMREDNGPYFEGGGPRVTAATATTLRLGTSATKKPSQGSRKTIGLSDLSDSKALIEGRQFECGCFALSHQFQGNCHNCGRIFCAQESLDYCYHCGLNPKRCLAYDLKVESGKLDEAAQQKNAEGYAIALSKRDELLQFAREKTKRTNVIDDQSGVFLEASNRWATKEQRDAAADAEAQDRRKKIVSLHKSSGAYSVHLDIVNQNVALGARVEDFNTASAASTSAPVANDATEDTAQYDDEEHDVDNLPELDTTVRINVNPNVTQKFWYVESAEQAEQRYGKPGKVANKQAQETDDSSTAGPKTNLNRSTMESCRLQNDYFEEDTDYYLTQASAVGGAASTKPQDRAAGEYVLGGKIEFFVSSAPEINPSTWAFLADSHGVGSSSTLATASDALLQQFEQPPVNGVTKEMKQRDEGMCLSMHQPWASLLVSGIKTHEGRTWDSDFRGKLWIHAASAKPSDIQGIEAHYAPFCTKGKSFPQHYPTGCLLGYVYVTDVLDHAAYLERFSESERQEDSPFKFICAEAKPLPMPLPMEGKHKIFKLDRKTFLAAKHQLNEK